MRPLPSLHALSLPCHRRRLHHQLSHFDTAYLSCAPSQVARLLGVADASAELNATADDEAAPRPQGLGLGARFLPHNKVRSTCVGTVRVGGCTYRPSPPPSTHQRHANNTLTPPHAHEHPTPAAHYPAQALALVSGVDRRLGKRLQGSGGGSSEGGGAGSSSQHGGGQGGGGKGQARPREVGL